MSLSARQTVKQHLLTHPHEFDFVQVIRLLQAISQQESLSVRLQSDPMPHGAPTEVTRIEKAHDEVRVQLGLEALSGCKGVIPDYLYAEMLHSLHQDDRALQRFLDVFNQRYYELKAYVESAANLMLREEREAASRYALSRLTQKQALACMFSLPMQRGQKVDQSVLRYGLVLASRNRNLAQLKRLLCDYFDLDITPKWCLRRFIAFAIRTKPVSAVTVVRTTVLAVAWSWAVRAIRPTRRWKSGSRRATAMNLLA